MLTQELPQVAAAIVKLAVEQKLPIVNVEPAVLGRDHLLATRVSTTLAFADPAVPGNFDVHVPTTEADFAKATVDGMAKELLDAAVKAIKVRGGMTRTPTVALSPVPEEKHAAPSTPGRPPEATK